MDRSFLSDARVVAASRNFVCIRLATYEDQAEADFLKTIYIGKSGDLENTTFAILAADGKTKLTRTGRAPFHEYRNGQDMAAGMKTIAEQQDVKTDTLFSDTTLPVAKNVEIGLNIAASDGLPLLVIIGENQQKLDGLIAKVLPNAWSEAVAGQFVYATALDPVELKPISGIKWTKDSVAGNAILIVEPDQFGLSGKVLTQLDDDASEEAVKTKLVEAIENFPRKVQDHEAHVRLGLELGIDWQSKIPETDPESLRAKERARGK
jgi:hypothetical protein